MKIVSPSQLDVNNPGGWPLFYKILLWILLCLVMAFLYNRFIRTPILDNQAANQSEISSLQTEYKTLYQYTLDLPHYQERSLKLLQTLQDLLQFLPSQAEMPDLIDSVYAAAVEQNITFERFTPEADVVREYYNIKPIQLETTTGYSNFSKFVESISSLERILNISDMSLSIEGDSAENLKIDSQLQTYIYTPDIQKFVNEAGSGD